MLFLLIFFFPHDLGAVSFLEQGHCLPAEVLFWNSHRFQQGAHLCFLTGGFEEAPASPSSGRAEGNLWFRGLVPYTLNPERGQTWNCGICAPGPSEMREQKDKPGISDCLMSTVLSTEEWR